MPSPPSWQLPWQASFISARHNFAQPMCCAWLNGFPAQLAAANWAGKPYCFKFCCLQLYRDILWLLAASLGLGSQAALCKSCCVQLRLD